MNASLNTFFDDILEQDRFDSLSRFLHGWKNDHPHASQEDLEEQETLYVQQEYAGIYPRTFRD